MGHSDEGFRARSSSTPGSTCRSCSSDRGNRPDRRPDDRRRRSRAPARERAAAPRRVGLHRPARGRVRHRRSGGVVPPRAESVSLAAVISHRRLRVASRVEVEFPGFVALPTEACSWYVVRLARADAAARRLRSRWSWAAPRRSPAGAGGPARLTVATAGSRRPAIVLYLAGAGRPLEDAPVPRPPSPRSSCSTLSPTYALAARSCGFAPRPPPGARPRLRLRSRARAARPARRLPGLAIRRRCCC